MVKSLPFSPRWGLRESSLIVGGYYSGDEHEQHFLQTVGSGNWYRSEYEEFRFRQDNHQLESVWFHVPEVNVEPEKQDVMSLWQFETPIKGLLTLLQVQGFKPEPMDFRFLDRDGKFLACIAEMALTTTKNRLRLRIAKDFDLLFIEQNLCGWLLSHPIDYLVMSWDETSPVTPDEQLASIVYEYLDLIAEPNIEKIEDEDPAILELLLNLYQRTVISPNPIYRRQIIANCIQDIIEQFYNQR
jgi:hypothetical protein